MPRSDESDATNFEFPNSEWLRPFRRKLNAWYERHARDLPWRRSQDPYGVWISEIMLQQTQVVTVIPYFERFMASFPTIADLAAAPEEDVLRQWEGLGYYRRARQLHKAAQQIVERHGGDFPDDPEAVASLPGIGRYTQGAILSIAFGQRRPILEANTIRLHARLLAYDGDTASTEGQSILWAFAEKVLPRTEVGTFNQALMELGGAVCTPKEPRCLLCPASTICPTARQGLQSSIPRPKKKTKYEPLAETAVVVSKQNQVLLRRCQEGERWAGLWDFPRFESEAERTDEAIRKTEEMTGVQCEFTGTLATIRHGVTKYRITLTCQQANYIGGRKKSGSDVQWVKLNELDDLPLSVTGRRIAKLLTK